MRASRRIRPKAVLIFGESVFDAEALKQLVMAARPDIPVTTTVERPPTLRRDTDITKHLKRAEIVSKTIMAALVKYKIEAVITHRDLDQVEPADDPNLPSVDEVAHCIELREAAALVPKLIATAPAWEMETWWLMWPEQVAKVRPSWKRLKNRPGVRVDKLTDSKEILKRELRQSEKPNLPDYSETDAPRIAGKIREDNVIRTPIGRAVAFERLLIALDQIP